MAGLGDHGVELDARWAAWMGSVVQAIYGRKTAGRTTVATLIVLAIASWPILSLCTGQL